MKTSPGNCLKLKGGDLIADEINVQGLVNHNESLPHEE